MPSIGGELKAQIKVLSAFVATFWIIVILNEVVLERILVIANGCGLSRGLNALGIVPHSLIGLRGILFAPFLHGGFYHVAANTAPFIILGWLVMLRKTSDFYFVSVVSAIASGLGTWLIGRPCSVHVGVSGVIFGYFGYLLFRGYFERSFVAIAISIAIAVTYGSLIWGVFPTNPYISWEGHLFGFIGGIIAAKSLSPIKDPQ